MKHVITLTNSASSAAFAHLHHCSSAILTQLGSIPYSQVKRLQRNAEPVLPDVRGWCLYFFG